jgi:glycine/D-amino acid oxidase-like deaminating enzyme
MRRDGGCFVNNRGSSQDSVKVHDTLLNDAPRCLYPESALPAVPTPSLTHDITVEVAVIGAGYTGLSAALHIAERDRVVALLEKREPGWGAAGRNGGQVNAGLKHDPAVVERDLGPVFGRRILKLSGEAPDFVFSLITRLGIDCEAQRGGSLRAAYTTKQVERLHAYVNQWRRYGAEVDLWEAAQVANATGTSRYVAAAYDRRGGSVNPLSFARGIGRAAIRAGCTIYGSTPATGLTREGSGWRIATPGGVVRAEKVIIATDGYSDDLWPGLRKSIVPLFSAMIATEPLTCEIADTILPGREVVYEGGNIAVYFRRDNANRLLMGGRGCQRRTNTHADYEHLVRYAERLWPQLARVEWTHWWNGQFALTPNFYPRFHAPAPNLFIVLGYSGRGLALGAAMGAPLASLALGTPLKEFVLPVTPVRAIPLHRLWPIGVTAGVLRGRLLDRLGH